MVPQSMELEGRINPSLSLPEILQFLGMNKMTGTLTIVNTGYTATLVLKSGKLVSSSSIGKPRRLGQMLIQRGYVKRPAVEEALAYQQDFSPSTPLGRILIHREHLTLDELKAAIRLQLEEELWDLFSLKEGSFKFEHGSEEELGEPVVELEIEPLIIEGTRRQDEWARIIKNIPNDRMVPSVSAEYDVADRDSYAMSNVEWIVLSHVNGSLDVTAIAGRTGIGRFETFRALNSFLASGLITLRQAEDAVAPVVLNNEDTPAKGSPREGADDSSVGGSSSTRLAAILFRWREGESGSPGDAPAPVPAGPLSFSSPASFIVALCNGLLNQMLDIPDFIVDPRDERMAERYWQTLLKTIPKADLIRAKKNVLESDLFERYLQPSGLEGPMQQVYDETMEALNRYLRTLFLLGVQRLGARTARKIFAATVEDFKQRSKIGMSENFFFNEFVSRALEQQS